MFPGWVASEADISAEEGAEVSCFLLPGYPWVNFSVEAGPPLIQLPMLFPPSKCGASILD